MSIGATGSTKINEVEQKKISEAEQKICSFANLIDEVLMMIFFNLGARDLRHAGQANHHWQKVSEDSRLWVNLGKRVFGKIFQIEGKRHKEYAAKEIYKKLAITGWFSQVEIPSLASIQGEFPHFHEIQLKEDFIVVVIQKDEDLVYKLIGLDGNLLEHFSSSIQTSILGCTLNYVLIEDEELLLIDRNSREYIPVDKQGVVFCNKALICRLFQYRDKILLHNLINSEVRLYFQLDADEVVIFSKLPTGILMHTNCNRLVFGEFGMKGFPRYEISYSKNRSLFNGKSKQCGDWIIVWSDHQLLLWNYRENFIHIMDVEGLSFVEEGNSTLHDNPQDFWMVRGCLIISYGNYVLLMELVGNENAQRLNISSSFKHAEIHAKCSPLQSKKNNNAFLLEERTFLEQTIEKKVRMIFFPLIPSDNQGDYLFLKKDENTIFAYHLASHRYIDLKVPEGEQITSYISEDSIIFLGTDKGYVHLLQQDGECIQSFKAFEEPVVKMKWVNEEDFLKAFTGKAYRLIAVSQSNSLKFWDYNAISSEKKGKEEGADAT